LHVILADARQLPVFLGGGGRECGLYPDAVRKADADLKRNYGIPPLALGEATPPTGFENSSKIGFHRFAVAYGLTRAFDQVPDWKLPSRDAAQAMSATPVADRLGVDYLSSKDAYD
jgi:hypothetical protein